MASTSKTEYFEEDEALEEEVSSFFLFFFPLHGCA